MTKMRKLVIVGLISIVTFIAQTAPARAAQPNNQACLGEDFSGYARNAALHPFGQTITTFAPGGTPIIEGGLGAEVQNHLAGNVPDTVLPNSCNN